MVIKLAALIGYAARVADRSGADPAVVDNLRQALYLVTQSDGMPPCADKVAGPWNTNKTVISLYDAIHEMTAVCPCVTQTWEVAKQHGPAEISSCYAGSQAEDEAEMGGSAEVSSFTARPGLSEDGDVQKTLLERDVDESACNTSLNVCDPGVPVRAGDITRATRAQASCSDPQVVVRQDMEDPATFLHSFLAQASDDAEAFLGLKHLRQKYGAIIKTTPQSAQRSWLIGLYIEMGERVRTIESTMRQ